MFEVCLCCKPDSIKYRFQLWSVPLWSPEHRLALPLAGLCLTTRRPWLVLAPALLGSFAEMLLAWLGQRETACEGDPVSCHSCGRNEALLIREFL